MMRNKKPGIGIAVSIAVYTLRILRFIENKYINLEVRHPRCVGSVTKNFVYYTYSQTQLYFTY